VSPNTLSLFGWFLEGVGLLVTLLGVVTTFRKAAPDSPLFDVQRRAVRRLRDRATATLRRLLRRRAPQVVGVVTIESQLTAFKARARVTYGPLSLAGRPKVADLAAATRELERRTNIAWTTLTELREKVDDEVERLDTAEHDLERRILERFGQLDEQARQMATSDVEVQVVGLGLIAAGFIFQTVGLAVGR
jgi:hypothetical protein